MMAGVSTSIDVDEMFDMVLAIPSLGLHGRSEKWAGVRGFVE